MTDTERAEELVNEMCQPPLLHGDEQHREWLRTELRKWIPKIAAYGAAVRREAIERAIAITRRNRRQIELSPAVGHECQRYGTATCDDIEVGLRSLLSESQEAQHG